MIYRKGANNKMVTSSTQFADREARRVADSITAPRTVGLWLYMVCVVVMGLVIFGGYVRLTQAGLSITEWNVITGVLPPMGDAAWQAEFAKYQLTPEFQKVNQQMTLSEYQTIFYIEYIHRLVARLAGLLVVVPLLIFLARGIIPWRKAGIYLTIVGLFGLQGFMGWYMVSSGLVDRPAVSHYRLTLHLLLALGLLALALWTGLTHMRGAVTQRTPSTGVAKLATVLLVVLILQIAYGGLVAGLKAGHASDTWPLMFGQLIPSGLLTIVQPWWLNLLAAATTVHFIHRWFALVVLTVVVLLVGFSRRQSFGPAQQRTLTFLITLVCVQIILGISVIWWHVPLVLALLHQATALLLFVMTIILKHQLHYSSLPG
jgi:cytochrome c oxidase assembly protein subunit 15